MIVYGICKTYPPDHDPIDGMGSFLSGGRWNPKGTYAVYTASSLALARAELARHLNLDNIPDGFRVYEIEIPENSCTQPGTIPIDWSADKKWSVTQEIGGGLLSDPKNMCFEVPSICDPSLKNVILNPKATNYDQVKVIKDYPFVP